MNDEVRTQLRELIAKNGTGLADDPRRVEAMLRDVAPHDTQEIFVLVSALRAQLVPEARQWHNILPPEALVRRLTDRLQRQLGLVEESARWSVESWLLALEIPLPHRPKPSAGEEAEPELPPIRGRRQGPPPRSSVPGGGPARGGRTGKLIVLAAGLLFLASVTVLPDYVDNGTGPRTLLQATSSDLASPLYPRHFWTPVVLVSLMLIFTAISFGVLRRSLMIMATAAALALVYYTFYIPRTGPAPGFGPYGSGYWLSLASAVIALYAGIVASTRSKRANP